MPDRVKDDCDHADICVMDPRCENYGECSLVACSTCNELFDHCRCPDDYQDRE